MIGHEVDFYIPPKVVVEVDGPVHLKPEVKERDEQTTTDLENVGYKVLRVPNYQTDTLAKAFGVTKRIRKLVGAQQPKS